VQIEVADDADEDLGGMDKRQREKFIKHSHMRALKKPILSKAMVMLQYLTMMR